MTGEIEEDELKQKKNTRNAERDFILHVNLEYDIQWVLCMCVSGARVM